MTGFSRRALLFCAILSLIAAGSVVAQNGVVSIERVGGLKSGTTTTIDAGQNVRFLIRYNNNTGAKQDISNGFRISSPDGATWDSTTIDSIGPFVGGVQTTFVALFDITFSLQVYNNDGVSPDTVGLLAAGNPTKANRQLPIGFNDTVLAVTAWFNGDKSSGGKHLCIDSAFYGVGGTWVWISNFGAVNWYPDWQGLPGQPYSPGVGPDRDGSGFCFDIYAPALGLTVDSLGFSAIQGGTTPPAQSFTVSSSGDALNDHLNFTLTEASAWLVKTPASGTTPRDVAVSMNLTGLSAGLYVDSIKVESPAAYNSPLWIKVTLDVIPPAPTIYVSKNSFVFAAVTGGTNPADQSFFIRNAGGSTLNWNLSKSSTWLGLSPMSGMDSNTVVVSADITGLPFGDHYDTIVVSDAAATNDPVRIPVRLTLGSSLPLIASDSSVYHVIVDLPTSDPPSRTINIFNGGIGTMTFTTNETSPRLFGVVPSGGTAPQSLAIQFKVTTGFEGANYFDTLWVESPEAINSPYPIVFHFRCLTDPPKLAVSRDTLELVTYACLPDQGPNFMTSLVLRDSFLVQDTSLHSGIPARFAKLLYESELFSVEPPFQAEMPSIVSINANFPVLPAGVYYDTIIVGTDFGYDSPQLVIVKYSRIEYGPNPQLTLGISSFDVPRQEQTGPASISTNVSNAELGCLPWYIEEDIPWFAPSEDSGNVPGLLSGILNIDDLTLGTYQDSFLVIAPLASNSPKMVHLKVRMWRYRGDCNWDGFINLVDLSWLIGYLVGVGPVPQPEYKVGDTSCDGMVDLVDLTRLIAYLTIRGTTICGNP